MRTVCTSKPLKQLEGFRACLLLAVKVRRGPALVVEDHQAACGIVAVPERERPAALVHIVFRSDLVGLDWTGFRGRIQSSPMHRAGGSRSANANPILQMDEEYFAKRVAARFTAESILVQ
jgi:hypothetical protein